MTARATDPATVGTAEPAAEPVHTEPVTVLAPFQVYWAGTVYFAGDRVALPADLAARYTLAGWVGPVE